jgi:hypothetical protein
MCLIFESVPRQDPIWNDDSHMKVQKGGSEIEPAKQKESDEFERFGVVKAAGSRIFGTSESAAPGAHDDEIRSPIKRRTFQMDPLPMARFVIAVWALEAIVEHRSGNASDWFASL